MYIKLNRSYLSKQMRYYRKRAGYDRKTIATLCRYTPHGYSQAECRGRMSLPVFYRFCRYVNTSPTVVLGFKFDEEVDWQWDGIDKDMDRTALREHLKRVRNKLCLSQVNVAEKLGVERTTYSRIESRGTMWLSTFFVLCQVFETDPGVLLGFET